jgi:hypothetical protein
MGISDQVALGIVKAIWVCVVLYFGYRFLRIVGKAIWQELTKRPQFQELNEALRKLKNTISQERPE